MLAGSIIMVTALIAASFCNSVSGLLATQGVLYAVGGLIIYFPSIQYIEEWFVVRRGMAYGVMWAGTGSAGIVVPFLLQWLLDSYGFRVALRTWAVILVRMSISEGMKVGSADIYVGNWSRTLPAFRERPTSNYGIECSTAERSRLLEIALVLVLRDRRHSAVIRLLLAGALVAIVRCFDWAAQILRSVGPGFGQSGYMLRSNHDR